MSGNEMSIFTKIRSAIGKFFNNKDINSINEKTAVLEKVLTEEQLQLLTAASSGNVSKTPCPNAESVHAPTRDTSSRQPAAALLSPPPPTEMRTLNENLFVRRHRTASRPWRHRCARLDAAPTAGPAEERVTAPCTMASQGYSRGALP